MLEEALIQPTLIEQAIDASVASKYNNSDNHHRVGELLQAAHDKFTKGDLTEAAQMSSEAAELSRRLQEAIYIEQVDMREGIIKLFAGRGFTVEYVSKVLQEIIDKRKGSKTNDVAGSPNEEPLLEDQEPQDEDEEPEPIKQRKKDKDPEAKRAFFTVNQEPAINSYYRLITAGSPEDLKLSEAAQVIYPPEFFEKDMWRSTINQAFNGAQIKLEKRSSEVFGDQQPTFPFTEVQIKALRLDKETNDFLRQVGKRKIYQGRTIEQCGELVRSAKPLSQVLELEGNSK